MGPGLASAKHHTGGPPVVADRTHAQRRRPGQIPGASAHRGTPPRASSSLPAPKRVPAREHHSAAGARNSRTVERPHETRAHQAQLDAGTAKPLHLEHSKMARRCALAAVTCIAATNAFVAPSRSVARPSSSHAQPTTPAAMRQQTYACSARINVSARGWNIYLETPSTRRQLNKAAPDSRVNVPTGN